MKKQNSKYQSRPRSQLIDRVRHDMIRRNYSPRTIQAYSQWILKYIYFHHKQFPGNLGAEHVRELLTHLAVNRQVAPSTRNQALNALVLLYRDILNQPLDPVTSYPQSP